MAIPVKLKTVEVDRIILGIDPGTTIMGYGIIKISGKKMSLISLGVIALGKLDNHPLKLKKIFERTVELIDEHNPDELAIEAPFFGKNVQSMLKLGRAQGVAMAAALHRNMHINEYSPRKIKQSITGSGNASKEQVASMLQSLLSIPTLPKDLDATDGLAAAVCHFFQNGSAAGGTTKSKKTLSGWKAFLSENPERNISSKLKS
jgi:crossover junction endodeoxyribonuclease RuvC